MAINKIPSVADEAEKIAKAKKMEAEAEKIKAETKKTEQESLGQKAENLNAVQATQPEQPQQPQVKEKSFLQKSAEGLRDRFVPPGTQEKFQGGALNDDETNQSLAKRKAELLSRSQTSQTQQPIPTEEGTGQGVVFAPTTSQTVATQKGVKVEDTDLPQVDFDVEKPEFEKVEDTGYEPDEQLFEDVKKDTVEQTENVKKLFRNYDRSFHAIKQAQEVMDASSKETKKKLSEIDNLLDKVQAPTRENVLDNISTTSKVFSVISATLFGFAGHKDPTSAINDIIETEYNGQLQEMQLEKYSISQKRSTLKELYNITKDSAQAKVSFELQKLKEYSNVLDKYRNNITDKRKLATLDQQREKINAQMEQSKIKLNNDISQKNFANEMTKRQQQQLQRDKDITQKIQKAQIEQDRTSTSFTKGLKPIKLGGKKGSGEDELQLPFAGRLGRKALSKPSHKEATTLWKDSVKKVSAYSNFNRFKNSDDKAIRELFTEGIWSGVKFKTLRNVKSFFKKNNQYQQALNNFKNNVVLRAVQLRTEVTGGGPLTASEYNRLVALTGVKAVGSGKIGSDGQYHVSEDDIEEAIMNGIKGGTIAKILENQHNQMKNELGGKFSPYIDRPLNKEDQERMFSNLEKSVTGQTLVYGEIPTPTQGDPIINQKDETKVAKR